jgi:GH35 family endo-1,4-beta-xylanase
MRFYFRRLPALILAMGLLLAGRAPAALPKGAPLLGDDLSAWKLVGNRIGQIKAGVAEVKGQDFGQALSVACTGAYDFIWDAQWAADTTGPVRKGDIILLSFWARTPHSLKESGDGRSQAVFELGRDPWTKSTETDLRIPRDWQRFYVRMKAADDYRAGEAHFVLRLGYEEQTLEFGGITAVDYGQGVDLKQLPVTKVTYEGMEPEAPWRAEALARAEALRSATLTVRVLDADGRPVPGAKVGLVEKKSAFYWGTAMAGERLMAWGDSPQGQKYRATAAQYFNMVTEENAFKWQALAGDWGFAFTKDTALATLDFAEQNGMAFHGHVLAWPGWQKSPARLKALEHDPPALRQAQLDHIADTMGMVQGRVAQWDVLNEPYDNHEITDILGMDSLVDWFKAARAADPKAQLCINDYSILEGGGGDTAHRRSYEATIKYLLDHGAPLDVIGLQGHFGMGLTSPADMRKILDRFAAFGKPLLVSEYDIITDDEPLAADFTRDLMITLYSHPAVIGMIMWGFSDGAHWEKNAPLFHEDWSPKPALAEYTALAQGRWFTQAEGSTDPRGVYAGRGYQGVYEVTASQGGVSASVPATLTAQGAEVVITLPRPEVHGTGVGGRGNQDSGIAAPGTRSGGGKPGK